MNTLKKLALATSLCAIGTLGSQSVLAQTTDAYHSIQIFPIVVDTGSFAQRFTFRNPHSAAITIFPVYYPGAGTAQASKLNCPGIVIAANSDVTFTSLRSICPALAAGSNFGFLHTFELSNKNTPYAAFSRVANPQGNGFSVEAFAPSTFTSATSVVTGVRRLAASGGSPAFQTNCFVANLADYQPLVTPVVSDLSVQVYDSAGVQLGSTTGFPLVPGQLTRLLDVFAAVGAPAGNYDNARVRFSESGVGEPSLMSFCTVQDNTSFGADFRIAKQEDPGGGLNIGAGPQDDLAARESRPNADMTMSGAVTRPFAIDASGTSSNTHVVYFRHPDFVQCEVIDPNTGIRALTAYGLEMRMLADDGVTVVGGGSSATGFNKVYLGDKRLRNDGANTRYTIEVESNGSNLASTRPYRLHCQSGSGHTQMDVVRSKEATDRF